MIRIISLLDDRHRKGGPPKVVLMENIPQDITINREVASAGWFLTRNIMLKAEYVNQVYQNYPGANIFNGGKFNGTMVEASIGF